MAGRKTFTAGEVLQAADVNDFLMDQSVMVFAGTAARGSAIPSPTEGMVTYRSDDDVVEVYNGSSFVPVGPGQILQLVSTTKTDTFSASVATTAQTAITGLTASLTPSSTASKVLIIVDIMCSISASANGIEFSLTRGGTEIAIGDAGGSRDRITSMTTIPSSGLGDSVSFSFLDTPSSTSALSYGVDVGHSSGGTLTVYVNRNATDSDAATTARGVSSITVMEVAG